MRIGIVATQFAGGKNGGLDTLFGDLVTAVGRHDPRNEYRVYVWPGFGDSVRPIGSNTRVVTISPRPRLLRRVQYKLNWDVQARILAEYLLDEPLDLLHFPFTTLTPFGLPMPKVLTFCDMQHEFWPEFFSDSDLEHRRETYKRSTEDATHIVAISDYTRQTLIDRYGTDGSKISTVHPAYDEARFTPAAGYAVDPDEPVFYYPARRWPHKNHARLLNAFADVVRTHPRARLRLTGSEQPEDAAVMRQVELLGLSENVELLGYVAPAELPGLYASSTALVYPSLFEGFGIPVIEALAVGCPVACSNTTSLPEAAGDAALYFDPTSEEETANAMLRLLADDGLRMTLRDRGFEQAKKFTLKRLGDATIEVYERTWTLMQ